jgi:predicted DsbA family dithiol-disulfide isomerase
MNNLTSLILILAMLPIAAVAQPSSVKNKNNLKMKVEIWSDVMCPFCYIGKRKFETAMAQMPQRENIEVIWKSFQLQPDLITDPSKNTIEHLAQSKGWTMAYTKKCCESGAEYGAGSWSAIQLRQSRSCQFV